MSSDFYSHLRTEDAMRLASKVFESTVEAIFITDMQGRIVSVNPAFTNTTGYSPEEVMGKDALHFHTDTRDPDFFRQLWESVPITGQWQGEVWNRRKNGEIYPEWLTISTVKDSEGVVTNTIALFSDITARKQAEERLRHLATHDALTNLPNRDLFQDRLSHAIARGHRIRHGQSARPMLAVMMLDLDYFKAVNDTLGHAQGDALLQEVSDRLRSCVRESDTVSRLGGDEFTLVIENIAGEEDAALVAHKVIHALQRPFVLGCDECMISASIGISLYPRDGEDVATLLKNADVAMYQAKETRNSYRFWKAGAKAAAPGNGRIK